MSDDTAIFVGASDADQFLLLKYANRHGLIAGATGTGKTVTLQTIAEGFAAYGVPVFMADVKGDLSGIGQAGGDNPRAIERAKQLKIEGYAGRAFPTIYWDLFGEKGHPVRTTVTEIGPVLMARLLQLNDTQEGVLNIVFKVADEQGLLLLDFKDLQTVLQWTAENAGSLTTKYGNVSKQSIGAIQRALLTLQQQGGERFFGEPALDLKDMIGHRRRGHGRHQHPRRRPPDAEPAPLRHLPALAAVGTVRGHARDRRSGAAEVRVLLRRGASPVRRCAQGAPGQDRAGGAAHPLQGRRHLLHHPEPARYP